MTTKIQNCEFAKKKIAKDCDAIWKKCIESITPRYQKKNYGKKTASHDSDDADFK